MTSSLQPRHLRVGTLGDPAHELCLAWTLDERVQTSGLRYRLGHDATWQTAAAEKHPLPDGGWSYRVVLTGLPPATSITWQPFANLEEIASAREEQTVRTAPASAPFTAVFFSDTGLIGRTDGNANGTEQVYAAIAEENPDLLLGAGDYAYANRDDRFATIPEAIDEWFVQAESLLARHPFFPQYGNHEVLLKERVEQWLGRFACPPGFDGGRSYSFRVGNIHFAALYMPDKEVVQASHVAWLDGDLARARRDGVARLVVFQHESIYGHGRSHAADPRVRNVIVPVLERHGVDLHLSAHDQNYERTYPLRHDADGRPQVMDTHADSYAAGQGVVYAKVSPAGKMSEIGNCFSRLPTEGLPFIACRDDTAHHYATLAIDARDRLELTCWRIEPGVPGKQVQDRFTID